MSAEAELAYLKEVFWEASEEYGSGKTPPMVLWKLLYEAVRDAQGGQDMIAKIQSLVDEIARLEAELER